MNKPKLRILLATALLWSGGVTAGLFDQLKQQDSGFLPAEQAFMLNAIAVAPDLIEARWDVAEGYYLYRHRLQFRLLESGVELAVHIPDGEAMYDEHFGDVEVYRDSLTAQLRVPAKLDGREFELEVRYQGCAEAGLCYPPRTERLPIVLPAE